MIHIRQTLLPIFLFLSLAAQAQKKEPVLLLKEGKVKTAFNITEDAVDHFNSKAIRHRDKAFAVLQFEALPTAENRDLLSKQGIELLEYIPENAYTVSITGKLNAGVLKRAGARTVLQLTPKQKMHASLAKGDIPDWAKKVKGMVDVWVLFPRSYKAGDVVQYLKDKKIEVLSTQHQAYQILEVRIPTVRLGELASLPFIQFVEPIPGEVQPLNMSSRNASRAGMLNASTASGGKGLNGEGVVIGIGDAGDVSSHADVTGSRLLNMLNGNYVSHATHVTATAAGAGVVNELLRGYASKATVISQMMSSIIYHTPTYVQDYGMVITNNSYGNNFGCGYGQYGEYNMFSQILDQHAFDFPYLQHVFAAGNDGYLTCGPYPAGYHTTFGSYQSAKNVLTVGATDWAGGWSGNSSRGPVQDGRTKPEITAMGGAVYSATLNNGYTHGWGTSFASPAVAGGLALLYQKYRQLYGGQNPKSGLMKALMCNGGADLGNKGPDFQYGFGWMNLLRSVEMLEKEQYRIGSVTNSETQTHTIIVPANTAQIKVMLYWTDPPASLLSSQALVNDLDLTVVDPSAVTTLPKKLDTSATGMLNVATTGADHINNMEQVVIDNPAAGTYSINIAGMVAQNPSQEYFVVYDIIPVSTTVTYPAGGEGLVPGETVQISWDSYGEPAGTFTLKYSTDNGSTWTDINAAVDAAARYLWWTVPNTPTSQALIRIERNGTAITHTSNPFTILGVPVVSLSPVQCEGYMVIDWTPVAGAADYEVMMKRDNEMVPVAVTTGNTFALSSLSPDSTYWLSVRARFNGKPGRRAVAVSRRPRDGTCDGSISDNDLKLDSIGRPVVGRKATATELSSAERVTIRVRNLDDAPVNGFTASYKINNRAWVVEQVYETIPAMGTYNHSFQTEEDLSAIGSYSLIVAVKNNLQDTVTVNDTLYTVIRQLDNQPIDLATPFFDDLENATAAVYTKDTVGLAGIDRYDFADHSSHGRLSTYSSWGVYSGSRALILGSNRYYGSPTGEESVTGTYNLIRYEASVHDLRLNFKARYSPQAKLWVRGSDDQSWIELLDFQPYSYDDSNFVNIEVSDSLVKYGQNFSSSFQLKWSNAPGNDNLFLDNITIYESFDDMQLLHIDATLAQSCGSEPLQVVIRNSSNKMLTNVPVRYSIDDGEAITEIVPSVAPNTTIHYKFITSPNFTAPGTYVLKVLVDLPTDIIRWNDTLFTTVNYAPLVTAFPYFQNFEDGDGGWFGGGENSSWEYGTPASSTINNAASGNKAWKTNRPPNVNYWESSELNSPCFEIGGMKNPTLSFSVAMDLYGFRDTIYDVAWVDYSTDNQTWNQLIDTFSAGTNWYPPEDMYAWGEQKTRWHVVTMGLPRNVEIVRLRIGRYKHPDAPTDGLAIDDIHIYDSVSSIYDGVSPSITSTRSVSGNNWVHFESDGKLIASVNPNGQNLGTTNVQAFIHREAVRYTSQQYYHNRNITIKPEVATPNDSVGVRLYFLDNETEALVNATGCNGCARPGSAYELGVSKYSDPVDVKENGTLEDNSSGVWSFIPPGAVTIVPFQKGYYAEFKVKDFSEFWLSNGGLDGFTSLPVKLIDFTAQKAGGEDVLLKWHTAQEANVSRYEVEVAKGETDLQAGRFIKIGAVKAAGNSTATESYAYYDMELGKHAERFYRLKMIDEDESFVYSPVRSVVFSETTRWQIYPNPSDGRFSLVYQLNASEHLEAAVYDVNGRIVREYRRQGSGSLQRLEVDLSASTFASGMYLLQTVANGRKEFYKLHKL